MNLIGKEIKKDILDEVREEIININIKLKLVVIQIGNNKESNIYINQKKKMCDYIGYEFEHINLSKDISTLEVLKIIDKLNKDNSVTGIMVQLPLPKNIDKDKVINKIDYRKDVDGLTSINNGKLFSLQDGLFPCTSLGVIELINRYNIDVKGKNVVIVGRSNLVGKPLSMMLLNMDANITICHSKTINLEMYTKNADILIVAIGKAKFINASMIKPNSIIIDVGINIDNNSICGDVDYDSVIDKVKSITPVPGGVGTLTIAMLAKNILKAYKMQIDFGGKYE